MSALSLAIIGHPDMGDSLLAPHHRNYAMNLELFEDTEKFAEQLRSLIDLPLFDTSPRQLLSDVSCSMSLEHWGACLNLLQSGMLPSGVVIHRAQFEALLRAIWILYAASEEHLGKLDAELTVETEQGAKNLPLAYEMMTFLEKKAPPQVYEALSRFKENSWKALNSYVHAGIHPLKRHKEGYPIALIENIVRNSNGLAVMSAMHAAVLSGVQPLQKEILMLAGRYANCMPQPL